MGLRFQANLLTSDQKKINKIREPAIKKVLISTYIILHK